MKLGIVDEAVIAFRTLLQQSTAENVSGLIDFLRSSNILCNNEDLLLEAYKHAHQQGWTDTQQLDVEVAALKGHVKLLRFFVTNSLDKGWFPRVGIGQYGYNVLRVPGIQLKNKSLFNAYKAHNIITFEWMVKEHQGSPEKAWTWVPKDNQVLYADILEKYGYKPTQETMEIAGKAHAFEMVKWLYYRGVQLVSSLYCYASSLPGRLDILHWLYINRCPFEGWKYQQHPNRTYLADRWLREKHLI